MSHLCPFTILGLKDLKATVAAVESAWRHRCLDCHPDKRPGDPTAKAKFEALAAAKEILLDPKRRAAAEEAAKMARAASAATARLIGACRAYAQGRGGARVVTKGATAKAQSAAAAAAGSGSDEDYDFNAPNSSGNRTTAQRADEIFFSHIDRINGRRPAESKQEPDPMKRPWKPKDSGDRSGSQPKRRKTESKTTLGDLPPGYSYVDTSERVQWSSVTRDDEPAGGATRLKTIGKPAPKAEPKAEPKVEPPKDFGKHLKTSPHHQTLPLRLPSISRSKDITDAQLAEIVQAATGAPTDDALLIARVLAVLRKKGGAVPLQALTRSAPKRVKRILSGQPRLFDLFLPCDAADKEGLIVSLRGEELELAEAAAPRKGLAKPIVRRPTGAPVTVDLVEEASPSPVNLEPEGEAPAEIQRSNTAWVHTAVQGKSKAAFRATGALVVDLDSDKEDQEEKRVPEPRPARPASPPAHESAGEEVQASPKTPPVKEMDEVAQDKALRKAFGNTMLTWLVEKPAEEGAESKRLFILVPPGSFGLLRPGHRLLLYSYDVASKVLYEYLPRDGTCRVSWSPSCPAVNAMIWTVLPLPPAEMPPPEQALVPEASESEEQLLLRQIDGLISSAAAKAGVQLSSTVEPVREASSPPAE